MNSIVLTEQFHKKEPDMQALFESLPTWVVALFSVTSLTLLFIWGARERVRTGVTKTFGGGLAIEVMGLLWTIAGVTLIMTTFASMHRTIPDVRAIQYVSAGMLCVGIGIFCYRSFLRSERTSKKELWAGHIIMAISGYLFYLGWQH